MKQVALVVLILGLLGIPSIAQFADGSRAPANRWYVAGGCSSRSRVARTRVPPAELVPAWSVAAAGRFHGETLVWDDKAVVLERQKDGDYRVLQIELATGRITARSPKVACADDADMAIWGRRALVTFPGVGAVGYGLTRSLVSQKWKLGGSASYGSPVLIKDDLYLREGGAIAHYRWGKRDPTWTSDGAYVGRFAVVGDEIFALSFARGQAKIDVLDRSEGKLLHSLAMGPVNTQFKRFDPLVQVGPSQVFVTLPGLLTGMGDGGNGVLLARELVNGRSRLQILGDVNALEPGVMRADGVFFRGESRSSGECWFVTTEEGYAALAMKSEREDLFATDLVPMQATGRIWLGDLAFEPRNGRIRRRSSGEAMTRAVPAEGMILLRSADGQTITALRAPIVAKDVVGSELKVAAGRAVLADGEVLEGRIEIADGAGMLLRYDAKDRETEAPLAEVLMVEDVDGLLRYRASDDHALRGLQILEDHDLGEVAYDSARSARGAKSIELLARYLDEATSYGVEEKRLKSLEKSLAGFEKKPPKPIERRVAEIEGDRAAAAEKLLEREWRRIAGLADDDHELRVRLLRRLLEGVPGHEGAREMVRSWLPVEIRPQADFLAADWLDLVLATRRRPIRVVIPPEKGKESEADAMQREVGAARHTWRPDVIGIASEQLLVITPLDNPSQLANCLTVGEMVGDELARMFGGVRDSRFPLRIHLFPTKKDYVDFHRKTGSFVAQFSLGNYSPGENVSRLFLPSDEDEFNDMLSTFVHEMTHHWISVRCPLISNAAAAKRARRSRGFWVVEGIATMMEEFVYDARSGEVVTDSPAVDSLDTVANCPDQALIPWNVLVLANQMQFGLMTENPKPIPGLLVPMTWQLGFRRQPSVVNLFYAQAGAVCHYLYSAEGGKYRQALMEFVGRYYSDEAVDWTPEKTFGGSPEELGAKVRAWAKERVSP